MHFASTATAAILSCIVTSSAAFAQFERADNDENRSGWTMTPGITTGAVRDDNIFVQSTIGDPSTDAATIINPSAAIDYVGRYTDFSVAYDGGFRIYRQFEGLDSRDHRGQIAFKRRLGTHTSLSAYQSYTMAPTTDVPALVGIPFARIGWRLVNAGVAFDKSLSKRTSLLIGYSFEWLRFDRDPLNRALAIGGQSHRAAVGVRRQLGRRMNITVDADATVAKVLAGGQFSTQNAWIGGDYLLTPGSRLFAMAGLARLDTLEFARPQLQPAWRSGVSHRIRRTTVEASYGRTFVPSYGQQLGTQQNEEISGRVLYQLQRLSIEGSGAWRSDDVVIVSDLPLTSVWMGASVAYQVQSWGRVEAFYSGLVQHIDRPGGDLQRNRVGVQFSARTSLRWH